MRNRKFVVGLMAGAFTFFLIYTVMAWLAGMNYSFAQVFVSAVHSLLQKIILGVIAYKLFANIFLPRILK